MRKTVLIALMLCVFAGTHAQSHKCAIDTRALIAEEVANGATEVRLLAKVADGYDRQAMEAQGIRIGAEAGNIVTMRVPVDALKYIESEPDILRYSISHRIAAPTTNRMRFDTRTDSVHAGTGVTGGTPFDGTGVYIGITDWGFDYTNPNFNNFGRDNFRIDRVWDHFRLSGPAPEGFDYGTEIAGWDNLIAAHGDTSNLYGYGTHGTHVAGIAAGRGINGDYQGQAPNARLLLCSFGLGEADWMNGVAWMRRVAQDSARRLVVNSSWGMYSFSTLDGTSLLSQAIDNWTREGIVFCTSAGNNGNDNFHISKTFAADTADTLRTQVQFLDSNLYGGEYVGQVIIMWGTPGVDFSVRIGYEDVYTPMFGTAGADTAIYDTLVVGTERIPYRVLAEHSNPFDQRPHIQIDTWCNHPMLLHATQREGLLHAWCVANKKNHAGNEGIAFRSASLEGYESGDNQYGIGEPACASQNISVAAHTSDDHDAISGETIPGAIAYFSSFGPLIDGTPKPEISAPGVRVISSISSWTTGSYQSRFDFYFMGRNYIWAEMSGTSMSSPSATGVVALVLQANPRLSTEQVRDIIFSTSRNDIRTGFLHERDSISDRWGWGKIDALAAVNKALETQGTLAAGVVSMPESRLLIYPNPATAQVTLAGMPDTKQPYQVYAADGRLVKSGHMNGHATVEVSGWTSGLYIVRVGDRTGKLMVR